MSARVDEALETIADLVREAESNLLGMKFDGKKKDEKIEELERELALAHVRIEELENRLGLARGGPQR